MTNLLSNGPWEPGSADENAWISDVFQQHGDQAWRLALRIVGNASDAEEVLQESLIKLVRRARKGRIHNPSAYLNAVIKTTAIDLLAKRKSDWLAHTAAQQNQNNPEQDDPSELIQNQELSARLDWAVAQLDPRLAQTVIARDLNQQSYAEIARAMNISCNTARIYHWLAVKKLREILSND